MDFVNRSNKKVHFYSTFTNVFTFIYENAF